MIGIKWWNLSQSCLPWDTKQVLPDLRRKIIICLFHTAQNNAYLKLTEVCQHPSCNTTSKSMCCHHKKILSTCEKLYRMPADSKSVLHNITLCRSLYMLDIILKVILSHRNSYRELLYISIPIQLNYDQQCHKSTVPWKHNYVGLGSHDHNYPKGSEFAARKFELSAFLIQ